MQQTNGHAAILGSDGRPVRQMGMGPEYGQFAVPPVITFSNLIGRTWHNYWINRQDQAMRAGREEAKAMENDAYLQALLNERKHGTAALKWRIDVDNERDPYQKAVKVGMTKIVKATPNFFDLNWCLLDGIWYGRQGQQVVYHYQTMPLPMPGRPEQTIPTRALCIKQHRPVRGDKISFHWDGTPYLQVHGSEGLAIPDAETFPSNAGRAIDLKGTWRTRFIIHTHEWKDADFFDGEAGDSIYGIGIRSVLFWLNWLRQEGLAHVLDWVERTGLGIRLWYYQGGNSKSKEEVKLAAETQTDKTNILVPRWGDKAVEGVDYVDTASTGADLLLKIQEHMEEHIERYVIGQTLSSSSEGNGLGGTGVADLHADTKSKIIAADAARLDDNESRDWIEVVKRWTYPWADFPVRIVRETEQPDPEKTMAAIKSAREFGVDFKEDSVRDLTGMEAPQPGDRTLDSMAVEKQQAQAAQQQAAMTQVAGQQGAQPGQTPIGKPGRDGQGQADPDDDEQEEEDDGEGWPFSRTGEPERYTFDESKIDRDEAGKFAEHATHAIHERAKDDPSLSYADIAAHVEILRTLPKAKLKEIAGIVHVHATSATTKETLLRQIHESIAGRKGRTERTTTPEEREKPKEVGPHSQALEAMSPGDLKRVGGWMTRRTGKGSWRIDTDEGHVEGDAGKIHEHIGRHDALAKLEGRKYHDALSRGQGAVEPDVLQGTGNAPSLPHGSRVVSLHPETHGRMGTVHKTPEGNRVKLDNEPGWASGHVEPLDEGLSWRKGKAAPATEPGRKAPTIRDLAPAPKPPAKPKVEVEEESQGNLYGDTTQKQGKLFARGEEAERYAFDPSEKRDEGGKWTQGGAASTAIATQPKQRITGDTAFPDSVTKPPDWIHLSEDKFAALPKEQREEIVGHANKSAEEIDTAFRALVAKSDQAMEAMDDLPAEEAKAAQLNLDDWHQQREFLSQMLWRYQDFEKWHQWKEGTHHLQTSGFVDAIKREHAARQGQPPAGEVFERREDVERYAKEAGKGRWVTIGGAKGSGGKHSGGSPVYIVNGIITKGNPRLTDQHVGSIGKGSKHVALKHKLMGHLAKTDNLQALHAAAKEHPREHVEAALGELADSGHVKVHAPKHGEPRLYRTGKELTEQAAPERTHRQEMNRQKDYERAVWTKKARQAGIPSENLHELAGQVMAQDKEMVRDRIDMLKHARNALNEFGGQHKTLAANQSRGATVGDYTTMKGIDQAAENVSKRFPHLFHPETGEHGSLEDQLHGMLVEGNPQAMSEDDAYGQAMEHLQEMQSQAVPAAADDDEPFDRFARHDEPAQYALDQLILMQQLETAVVAELTPTVAPEPVPEPVAPVAPAKKPLRYFRRELRSLRRAIEAIKQPAVAGPVVEAPVPAPVTKKTRRTIERDAGGNIVAINESQE